MTHWQLKNGISNLFSSASGGRMKYSPFKTSDRWHSIVHLAGQVNGPVDQIEEGEHEWEENARDDVDAFGTRREFGDPRATSAFCGRTTGRIGLQRIRRKALCSPSRQAALQKISIQ